MSDTKPNNGLSIIEGPPLSEEVGLGALTLGGLVAELAERFGDNEALRWRGQSWSYADMYAESERVAKSLLACGANRGTRVGVLISNRPEWLFSMFGASMVGAITVAMNTFSTPHELAYQLQHADVALLITEAEVAKKDFVKNISDLVPALAGKAYGELMTDEFPFLRRVVCIDSEAATDGIQRWDAFLASGESIPDSLVAATMAAVSPVDQGLIFFSSGTTALPKAIQQTHRAAALQVWRFGQWFEMDQNARVWSANGFFWSGNFAMAFGAALSVGACLVLQRYFDPDEALELLQRERVNLPLLWPHQSARFIECPGWLDADVSALKYIDKNQAMATHPQANKDWVQPNGYGMTETFTFITGVSASQRNDDSFGSVLHGNTLRIVDPISGEILPYGESGEIICKGPTLMSGYLKIPSEDVLDSEGFIHTGDVGHLNENGNLVWEGRLSDIIKTGGANVSPAEIDAVLVEHPAVQYSFTVGVPHDTLGEIVVACIVLREGRQLDEDGLRAYAKQTLASYKVPRRVLFFAEEELPMTGSNKVQRPELRKLVSSRLEQETE